MGSEVCYFTAFDDNWKTDTPATFNAEKVCLILSTNVIIHLLTRILALGYQKSRLLSTATSLFAVSYTTVLWHSTCLKAKNQSEAMRGKVDLKVVAISAILYMIGIGSTSSISLLWGFEFPFSIWIHHWE